MIQNCNTVRIDTDLTRFSKDNAASPFRRLDWKRAKMKFCFVDGTTTSTQHGDFQQYRKVHAVVGIMSCISEGSVEVGFQKYNALKKNFASSNSNQQPICGKCIAVEPLDAQLDVNIKGVVIIPNQDIEHQHSYIERQFNDLVGEILKSFETYANNPNMLLDSVQSGNPNSAVMRRQNLKTLKIFGDYAMLVGDFNEALEKYTTGIEIAKLLNDDLYLAGCLEASASAIFLLSENDTDDATLQQISDKMDEAIAHYAKVRDCKELHVEAMLKHGFFNARCGRVTRKTVAMECASKAVQEASQLNAQDRILVSGAATKICYEIKCMRKFTFFLRYTSLLHHELCNQGVSIRLGAMCLDALNVPIAIKNNQWEVNQEKELQNQHKRKKLKIKEENLRGWKSAQQILLEDLVEFAKAMDPPDCLTEAQILLHLLSDYYEYLTAEEQKRYFVRFCNIAPRLPKYAQVTLRPFPILKAILPIKLSPNMEPHPVHEVAEKKDTIFIFSPFDKEKETKLVIHWVQNELAQVQVVLHNPFKIPLALRSIAFKNPSLNGQDHIEVYENKGLLKPDHELKFILLLRPLDVGPLTIQGIQIEFENCALKHSLFVPWDMKQQIIREKRMKRLEKYKLQTSATTAAMSHSKQNDDDYNEKEEGIEIKVVESIPILHVLLATTTHHLLLYDGELLDTSLVLLNVGDACIDFIECSFVNHSKSEIRILDDPNTKCPFMPHEPSVNLSLQIRARWNGNDDPAQVMVHVRYGNHQKWFRRITLPLSLTVTQGLVLEHVTTMNQLNGKQVVGYIRNMANVPFVLSSVNEQSSSHVISAHHHHDHHEPLQQFDKGIPFAPGAIKTILVNNSVLHPPQELPDDMIITDPENQFLKGGDPHRHDASIPYTASVDEYKQFIASRLQWRSYVNTSGTVGCGFVEPLHVVVPELASERKQLKQEREQDELLSKQLYASQVDLNMDMTVSDGLFQVKHASPLATHEPIIVSQNKQVDVVCGQPVPFKIHVSHTADKSLVGANVVVNVYQDGEHGSRVMATPDQLAINGKLISALNEFKIEQEEKHYTIELEMYFLESGAYRVIAECCGTTQKLAPPLQVKLIAIL
ncbi:hypothetical protein AKO1_008720 [Acrasis kona]|uniref:Trafficking protein particle complex subunit 11 n=1 Tax=Acrasis kona TaxID=1008807 RepID=A0AAW2ZD52_9EUKA